jgi:signal transduction histidine kinase
LKDAGNKLKDEATTTTTVYVGAEPVTAIRVRTLSNAKRRLDVCDDSVGTVALVQFQPVRNALVEAAKDRRVNIRFITDIRQENLASCKELLDFGVELRHYQNIRGNFVVTEREYYAFAQIKGSKIPLEVIYSNNKVIIEQQQFLFDTLWDSAIPGKLKIRELEQGIAAVETKIVRGSKEIENLSYSLIDRSINSHLYVVIDDREIKNPETTLSYVKGLLKKDPKFRILLIADIQERNSEYYKALLKAGIQVRHIDRNKVTFLLSGEEYLSDEPRQQEELRAWRESLSKNDKNETTVSRSPPLLSDDEEEATWTNNPEVIVQMNQIFQTMWKSAIRGEERIKQLEEGIEPQETRLFEDLNEVIRLGEQLIDRLKFEVLIIAASDKMLLRNREAFRNLRKKQLEQPQIKVRILAPLVDPTVLDVLPRAEWRKIDPSSVSIMIFDKKWMLITQYVDSFANSTQQAVASNIYSSNRQTILGVASVFEALWRQSELRESEERARAQLSEILVREERSRRQAELLQDILTHDIRNYNQVSKLSAELLREKFARDTEVQTLINSLLESIDGSTSLVERGRKLGRILSEESATLYPVDLIESIERSLTLVKQINRDKVISERFDILSQGEGRPRRGQIFVEADDLLEEVFSNVFSNSVKYTTKNNNNADHSQFSPVVELGIMLKEMGEDANENDGGKYWMISLSDRGPGISQDLLSKIFDRYLAGAKGSGLGLSIVHALVVHRYKGKVQVTSSQETGASGTTIQIWLRRST